MAVSVKICSGMEEIDPQAWNNLVHGNNPFVRYEFLAALEKHGCAAKDFGWLPCHLAVYEDAQLIGAMPLYEKHNSYGEFVFDQAWADAYQRHGLRYFPKLVCSVPYTPAGGQRLLCVSGKQETVYPLLLQTAQELAKTLGHSGIHWLFPKPEEHDWLRNQGLLVRHDCQFHWHNRGYTYFDDFLAQMSSKKRKNIRQERHRVQQAGITFRRLSGHTASAEDWRVFTHFYEKTFAEKWGYATLNYNFFYDVAQQLPDQILLVLADLNGQCIAGSLLYIGETSLYGRYWGCLGDFDGLHFEACYYQGIEYCIENRLQSFEPGAQGEHKLARGFEPTLTRSAHWMREKHFESALERFVSLEREGVADYIAEMQKRSPFRAIAP